MDTSYESVVDPGTLVFTLAAYLLHGFFAASQLGLSLYLLVSGLRAALRGAETRSHGWLRLVAAVMLLLPLLLGAPFAVSILACVGAIALLTALRPDALRLSSRGLVRTAAVAAALLVAAFSLWEREDSLGLGFELVTRMNQWRAHEVDWQLDNDRTAPKLGELAPDFELQDPSGATQVRLADFRGKRPVALLFGSYT